MNDLKFAIRLLRKNPGFTAVAVLTLALGIGANLALFAMLNELLLRPKPVANPDELWAIEPANAAGQPISVDVNRPYYEAIRQHASVFKGIIGYSGLMPKLRTKEGVELIYAELVSGDYFSFLGVPLALGRGFFPEEDAKPGTHSVAVISHAFWQGQFGGAADVIGSTVTLNDKVIEIVGVSHREFNGLDFMQPALWMPTSMEKLLSAFPSYKFVGRLAEPGQAAAAGEMLAPVVAEVTSRGIIPGYESYGYVNSFQGVRLDPTGRGSLGFASNKKRILDFLKFASVATVLLLFIAGANVASLFLARAIQRRKEMATRLALGATRGVLVRQLVVEGILIAALGTAGALLAFSWLGGLIARFASWWRGPDLHPALDLQLLLFAIGSLLLVGVGFSLFPALQATGFQPFNALKNADGGDGPDRKRAWLRPTLIVAQIVGSLVLLCGATLCLRSMSKQMAVDVGFRSDRLAIAPLNLERDTMKNALGIQHAALRILGLLGSLALALCVIGIYGVTAYLVTRRTREIGVRMALGATRGAVMKLILTAGLRLGFIALAIGLPLALGTAALLRHQLAGISPFDPVSFLAVSASVLTALLVACWLPARRGAKVDPMVALRYE